MIEFEHKPQAFDEAAFDAAVSKPNGWSNVADPVAEIRRMRDGDAPGNSAALREALEAIDENTDLLDIAEGIAPKLHPSHSFVAVQIRKIAHAALAAPARNCDVGTKEEQAKRFKSFCDKHDRCGSCPLDFTDDIVACPIEWGQMPFAPAEGGAE